MQKLHNPAILQSSNHPIIQMGTAECAERLDNNSNSPYPDRGAGVLDPSENPGRTRRACLSLPLRRALRGPSFYPVARRFSLCFDFSVFFGARKNGQQTEGPKINVFC